jgi:regulator of sirC expression with transglutaminase-like and TPR domain
MRYLGWLLLALLGSLAAMQAAAQTSAEVACFKPSPGRNTVAACNRRIVEISADIKLVASPSYKPPKGRTRDGQLAALYIRRGGAHQVIARRHAGNAESDMATELHLRAIRDFDTALRHDPASPHAFLNRGRSRAELGELDSAIADFDQALRLDAGNAKETNAAALNNRGAIYRNKSDESKALADLERALRLAPKYAEALFNRGTVHLEKERYERAIADYTAAMRLGLADIESYNARGRARRDSGDYKGAVADFEAALKLTPPDKRSKNVQDALRKLLGALREKAGREEAERRRAQREEAEREEAARKEAAAAEAARKEAAAAAIALERAEAAAVARRKAEAEAATREEIARRQAAAAQAARERVEAEKKAAREAARREAAEKAALADAARKEALAAAAAHKEARRLETERRKQAQEDARRAEATQKEALRLEALRKRAEQQEAQRRKEAADKAAHERVRRVALAIGNSGYDWLHQLKNPRHDAEDVAKALESLNFTVFRGIDLGHARMKEVLKRFAEAARAEEVEVAIFFFAGHGMQHDNASYLAPIDASGTLDRNVGEYISLEKVLDDLASNRGFRIVIVDACRNSATIGAPPSSEGEARRPLGLADVKPPASKGGMLIAYAAEPGKVAKDGVGRNSPFTRGVLKHLLTPGLELRTLFVLVRGEVLAATGDEQRPHVTDTQQGLFYFMGAQ